ncbi:hypothetical protein Scep_022223 [Stephania cephalantha]|uniref:Uncharacterized protein n=1 Tax=Stephania cephalantha TaxID=152367 RepID=A0AAP0F5R7_9MAGN
MCDVANSDWTRAVCDDAAVTCLPNGSPPRGHKTQKKSRATRANYWESVRARIPRPIDMLLKREEENAVSKGIINLFIHNEDKFSIA